MKDLNVYIEELLYKHQCVIIPKFGAFISNRKSAQMADDKTFDPPKRELSFNPSLTSNDGLLIKYISEQTGIEYNLVEDYVNLAVEGWKRILQQDQALNLEKIGTLKLVGEGRISFEAADDVNFLTDSFGMAPFVPHEVTASDLKIEENQVRPTLEHPSTDTGVPNLPPEEDAVVTPPESPVSQVTAPVVTNAPKTHRRGSTPPPPKEKKPAKIMPYVKYTAVASVGLAILAYGAYLLFGETVVNEGNGEDQFVVTDSLVQERLNQKLSEAAVFTPPITIPAIPLQVEKVKAKKPEQVKPEQPKPQQTQPAQTPNQSTAVTTTKPANTPAQVATTPKPAQTNTAPKPAQTTTAPKPAHTNTSGVASTPVRTNSAMAAKKYQVIAGAFKDERNAETRVKQLQKLGYRNAFVLGTNARGLYQVSYGGFDSMDEAKLQQKEVQASKEEKKLDGGWILTQP
ncbi:hypothetical protein RCZ04_04880 [Capnocytophaga sp. HP1101]